MTLEKLLALQRLVMLGLLGWFASRVAVVRHPAGAPPAAWPLRVYAAVVMALFTLVFAGQAFWTLLPGDVPALRGTAKYDPRAWRLESLANRRAIVDRAGRELVGNRAGKGGIERVYPLGSAAAHVTGYYHRLYGKTGLEQACDVRLTTWRRPAWELLASRGEPDGMPAPLTTTIDVDLQKTAFRALGSRRGAVVVLSPAQSDVLALVSRPAFDPNRIDESTFDALAADRRSPLLNRAIHGLYPPGSTFKPVVAAVALTAGYPLETRYEADPRGYLPPFDTRRIKDHEAAEYAREGRTWPGHGELDMPAAMARSANGYFAWLGVQVGAEALLTGARAFGLDRAWPLIWCRRPAAELTSTPGRLPAGPLKPADIARCAIGQQDLMVTPLSLALVTATIANYGSLVPPRMLLDQRAAPAEQILDPDIAAELQRLMRGVVADPKGTGRGLRLRGVPVAAKTGSAENPHGRAHGWVVAFAPVDAATIALAVLVENGGSGSGSAGPVARAVLEQARRSGYFTRGGEADE